MGWLAVIHTKMEKINLTKEMTLESKVHVYKVRKNKKGAPPHSLALDRFQVACSHLVAIRVMSHGCQPVESEQLDTSLSCRHRHQRNRVHYKTKAAN